MTPEEEQQLQESINQIAEILYRNTPEEKLKDFETIEQTVRDQILEEVAPLIGEFFFTQGTSVHQVEPEHSKAV